MEKTTTGERRRASCEFGELIAKLRSYTLQNAGGHDGMLVVLVVQDWHYIWVVPVMAIDKKHISVSIDSSRDLAWRVEDEGSVLRRRFLQVVFSTSSATHEIVAISNASKVDAIFQPQSSSTSGTQIQLKAASSTNVSLLPSTDAHCMRS